MKKNSLKVTLVAAFALFAGYNVYTSQKSETISDLVLANAEALADGREGFDCKNGCIDGSGGCECNDWYQYYAEYRGSK